MLKLTPRKVSARWPCGGGGGCSFPFVVPVGVQFNPHWNGSRLLREQELFPDSLCGKLPPSEDLCGLDPSLRKKTSQRHKLDHCGSPPRGA